MTTTYKDFLKLVLEQSESEDFSERFSEEDLLKYSKQWYQDVNDVDKIIEDEKYDVVIDILQDCAKTSVWSKYLIDNNIEENGLYAPGSHYRWAKFIVSSGNKGLFMEDPASEEIMKLLESYFKEHNSATLDIRHLGIDNEYEIIIDATPDLELLMALNMKMKQVAIKN